MTTRDEHLAWCKQRALEYVGRGELTNAVASMMSDLGKHPDTAPLAQSVGIGMLAVGVRDRDEARRFVEGFR